MCDCIEKFKKSFQEKGMYNVAFDNKFGERQVLIPFTYQTKNKKTGELTKKVWRRKYIPKYCPFCGQRLREGDEV